MLRRSAERAEFASGTVPPDLYPDPPPPDVWAKIALALFVLTLALSMMAVKFGPGPLPWRSVTLVGCGGILAGTNLRLFEIATRRMFPLLVLIAAVAALGVFSSVIAHAPATLWLRQLLEIHVQAAISVVVTYALVMRIGVRPVLIGFIAVFMVSGVVALLQGLGLSAAWDLRAAIGNIVHDRPETRVAYVRRERALGLALSTIQFAYQTCLALAAMYMLRLSRGREANQKLDIVLVGFTLLMIVFSMATGNRSPLLGLIAFLPVYVAIRAPRLLPAALPLILLGVVLVYPILQALSHDGLRVASTEDGSAAGRETLRQYGLFLLGQRPLGYGLGFNSTQHWQDFFIQARYLPNPAAIQNYALHNCYLNLLMKYGVLLLAFVPFILPRNRAVWLIWVAFIPYAIHIFYHNEGPFQGDFLFFFLVPIGFWLARRPEALVSPAKPRRKTWRRAFAPART